MVLKIDSLSLPDLPQITSDNKISKSDITVSGGVFFRIHEYSDPAHGDVITVLWDDIIVKGIILDTLDGFFPVVGVVTKDIDLGEHYIKYTVEDDNYNTSDSPVLTVTITEGEPEPEIKYPAPVFIDAVNNIIDQISITNNAGAYVLVNPYDGIAENDEIILIWKGEDADGNEEYSGFFDSTITSNEVDSGVLFLIPKDKLEALGDNGTVTASYRIIRDGEILGLSYSSTVVLDLNNSDDGDDISICISTGAANTDYEAINVYPFNQGVVKGPAGAKIILSVVGDAIFNETETSIYEPVLDEDGEANFKLFSTSQGSNEIIAEKSSDPANTVSQVVRFGAYEVGDGNITHINYSTNAPANSVIPCSIYIKTSQTSNLINSLGVEITIVRVTIISGSATIDGYPGQLSADIILNSDNSAEIDILDSESETVEVELTLPESSGSSNRVSLYFREF